MYWSFEKNLNSYANRAFAANEPVGSVGLHGDGCVEFNGTGGLQIPYFKNGRNRENWVVGVVFNRDVSQDSVILYKTPSIFINGDVISASASVMDYFGNKTTLEVSVTAPGAGFLAVVLRFDGTTLTLSVYDESGNLYQDSVNAPGEAAIPWAIFYPPQEPLFVGHVPADANPPPGLPGSYSGKICMLYFTDELSDDDIGDILGLYSGPGNFLP
ncbi:uncharacterized protein LOC112041250 [Lingula anatina]|uniref:Uncharacterized protein LOC112041250 n=1 Tax=Lingula anatina TaxID=7574 RepID=A0A2R2MSJ1_LINAN|nr:uncharacterized protein LOC112041250 [Lingula anatina]|eukprot:XP_023932967.1 uncharacterized protein LOC112041250 [Lingula anatina]